MSSLASTVVLGTERTADLAAHAYQLSFESNPAWTEFFALGQEILDYWKRVVEKYDIRKLIRFSHECVEAKWIESTSKWLVTFQNLATGETIQDSADVFMTGIGILNKWKMPKIKGLETFEGPLLHTAQWDSSFEPKVRVEKSL
jgi:cation diffusion facilitator CzcD-associated flavoprotein CzcO